VPELREERRIVTALFADVVGSTPLADRLDAEDVNLIIGEAVRRVIRVVESYGGTIQTLAGDGVMALFGAPLAHEDDAERAVRAALDIISISKDYAVEVSNSWDADFAMRVGVHTGIVVAGQLGVSSHIEYGAIGDTLNTTARLEAAADKGTVLVSSDTYGQVESLFEWGEERSLALKGKADPVSAYPVVRPKSGIGSSLLLETGPPMIGREAELSLGLELVERLSSGRGSVLFIVGEPGIGKSRLAAELRREAMGKVDVTWLEGRCVSYGQSLSYWPFRDLLRNWLDASATEPDLRLRLKLHRKLGEIYPNDQVDRYPYIAAILGLTLEPEFIERLKPLSPESLQYQTFEVVNELISRLSSQRPVVIALDDLHWADSTSIALTEKLLSLAESSAVMLILGQRPETDHSSWQLKEAAARDFPHLFKEARLRPLSRDSEVSLLNSLLLDRSLPEAISERLLDYAEGNPFYLEQMVRSVTDYRRRRDGNGSSQDSFQIPQTLEGVIIARIDRLQATWRTAVTAASVLGRVFTESLLQSMTGIEGPELGKALHHLRRLDLIREEAAGSQPVYRFKHALIQETAYRTLTGPDRSRLHRRAAQWFMSFYQDRPERVYGLIAHHWLGAGDTEHALRYLKLAGDKARDEWALDEAVDHYRKLVPLLETAGRGDDASEVLFQLGTTLHLAMRYREANDTWQQAFAQWRAPPSTGFKTTAYLRMGVFAAPWETDPVPVNRVRNVELQRQLHDGLLDVRPGPYIIPGLLDRWEVSSDGRRYSFHLGDGAKWNDDSPLSTHDVVEGLKRILDPGAQSPSAPNLFPVRGAMDYSTGKESDFGTVGIVPVDDATLQVHLVEPCPWFIFVFANPPTSGAQAGRARGPFRVRHMTKESVVVERDPGYRRWRGGNIAVVEWVRIVGNDAAAELRAQRLDVVVPGPYVAAWTALDGAELVAEMGPLLELHYLVFVPISAGGPDIYLRRALAHATDRSRLTTLSPNETVATGGLVPPGVPGHTPDIAPRFDLDLARALLGKSSHRGPFDVGTALSIKADFVDRLLEAWREMLGLDIRLVDVPLSDTPFFSGDRAKATIDGFAADFPDPESFFSSLRNNRASESAAGDAHFSQLLHRATAATTSQGRLAVFHELDKMLVESECEVIPLVYRRPAVIRQSWVHGWWEWSTSFRSFDSVTVDQRSPRYQTAVPSSRGPGGDVSSRA
jgi:class 3 adenylate cyclase/ABC-type oligopeptide transport system substrate-binding subunit